MRFIVRANVRCVAQWATFRKESSYATKHAVHRYGIHLLDSVKAVQSLMSRRKRIQKQALITSKHTRGLQTLSTSRKDLNTVTGAMMGGVTATFIDEHVRANVTEQLDKRGMVEMVEGLPDILVRYQAALSDEIAITDETMGAHGVGERVVYRQGALLVDLIDPNSEEVIWRGAVSDAIEQKDEPADGSKIRSAIAAIFSKFPK